MLGAEAFPLPVEVVVAILRTRCGGVTGGRTSLVIAFDGRVLVRKITFSVLQQSFDARMLAESPL